MGICSGSCQAKTQAIAEHFGRAKADEELRRYGKDGPVPTTRALIAALRSRSIAGAELLDVGAGVGAIHHALLDEGAARAVHVDISPQYVNVAREEAKRRGHDNVSFVIGDFLEVAPTIEEADIVTLDRVICCYGDMERLVEQSAAKARRLYGAVYPRDKMWTRIGVAITNLFQRLRRLPFRTFVHSPAAIDAILRRSGFERSSLQRTWAWEVVVYARVSASAVKSLGTSPAAN